MSDFGILEHFWKNRKEIKSGKKVKANFPPTHFQHTPTGGENFLARFNTFTIFPKIF